MIDLLSHNDCVRQQKHIDLIRFGLPGPPWPGGRNRTDLDQVGQRCTFEGGEALKGEKMFQQSLSARFRAIEELQAIRARHTPGTPRYEDVEHAIDLALHDGRSIDEYVIRNVLRDAERIRTRRQAKHSTQSLDDDTEDGEDSSPADSIYLQDHTSPEALAIANDLARALLRSAPGNRKVVERTLAGLIAGETAAETAKACGVGVGYIEKVRMGIKAVARELFPCGGLQ